MSRGQRWIVNFPYKDYVKIYSKEDININSLNNLIEQVKLLAGSSLDKLMATLEAEITPQEVIEQIRSLKHGKASGSPDNFFECHAEALFIFFKYFIGWALSWLQQE